MLSDGDQPEMVWPAICGLFPEARFLAGAEAGDLTAFVAGRGFQAIGHRRKSFVVGGGRACGNRGQATRTDCISS